ncbi:ABC transporter substrate-binding protein [Paenibacillus sinopodophylli]|uniref:ABC transporter substrate-binding protein n=1 Tax=Paenibacillus sinopodophylli TaxID=1837342 RepID=UPI00110CED94|nr:ABC transporter substrate-binding protein [Paenibacillus sinopodophylli]
MKKKMGWTSLLLALILTLSACSGSGSNKDNGAVNSDSNGESSEGSEKPYEVVYAYPTFDNVPVDIQLVQDEINEISKAKINVTVKLMPISNSAYGNQINLMMSSGEKMDMFAMLGNYNTQVSKGMLHPIGDIMEENAQGIIDALGPDYYNATKVDGVSFGVPSIRDLAQDYGFVMRKDLADKYSIDFSQIKTFDDYGKLFQVLKSNEPDMVSAANASGGSILGTYRTYDQLGNELGVLLNNGLDDLKVVNWFASDEYENMVRKLREWYLDGYLLKDAATTPESTQAVLKSGKAAGYFSQMKPGFESQEGRIVGQDMVAVRTVSPVAKTDTVTNVALGVSAKSENPEKTLQFLNLMYTDKEIVNLIDWGIEGKHYVKADGQDIVIRYPEGVTGDNVSYKNYGWMHGNQFLSYVFEGDEPDVYVNMDTFNKSASKSKALGFTFNGDPVKNEIAASNAVLDQYKRVLESGAVDVDKVLPEFLKKLTGAGIDKIIAEKQNQLDKWAASNSAE